MADVKHCTTSPINDFEGFLHIFYCRIKNFTESLTDVRMPKHVNYKRRACTFFPFLLLVIVLVILKFGHL
jgi:hypothetical protein